MASYREGRDSVRPLTDSSFVAPLVNRSAAIVISNTYEVWYQRHDQSARGTTKEQQKVDSPQMTWQTTVHVHVII